MLKAIHGSRLDHPLHGAEVAFATMHRKEEILAPLFQQALAINLRVPQGLDTDQFGTFSGEVERDANLKEVLRRKARAGMEMLGLSCGLASEGSFGPHPYMPFMPSNHETLLFLDMEKGFEIFSSHTSTHTSFDYCEVSTEQDLQAFLEKTGLGSQAVILKPDSEFKDPKYIYKGVISLTEALRAYAELRKQLSLKKIWVETDNRAYLNPKRRAVIAEAGKRLIEKIMSLCPCCQTPGFAMVGTMAGLACEACGVPSEFPKEEVWQCPRSIEICNYEEFRPRADGKKYLPPEECSFCNP